MNESRLSELDDLISRLRASRPQIGPTELESVKTRVVARTHRRRGRPEFLAFAVLALAVFAGGTGVTLGAAALSDDDLNAAVLQYAQAETEQCPDVSEACFGLDPESGGGQDLESGGQDPPPTGGDGTGTSGVQPTEQLASVSPSSLAFTGYLAIPALAVGLMLGCAGLLMLRRLRQGGP